MRFQAFSRDSFLRKFFAFFISPKKKNVSYVASSLIGLRHAGEKAFCEDTWGAFLKDNITVFYVIDGAGGMANHEIVADEVKNGVDSYLRYFFTEYPTIDDISLFLTKVMFVANSVARDIGGMATYLMYVSIHDRGWGLIKVGDPVFLGRYSDGATWEMPIEPTKIQVNRNLTMLIGTEEVDYQIRVGKKPFREIFLFSDWVCSSCENALVRDHSPHEFMGTYYPNQNKVNILSKLMRARDNTEISTAELEYLLFNIQRGNSEFAVTKDDLTLLHARF